MTSRIARVAPSFLKHIEDVGLTDDATARAIGITPEQYSAIKRGDAAPSLAFMAGAVHSGLAATFSDVAEPVLATA